MLNDIEFNDPSANLKPVPIRKVRHGHGSPKKNDMPDSPSKPPKQQPTHEQETFHTIDINSPRTREPNNDPSSGKTRSSAAAPPPMKPNYELSVENPEDESCESQPTKMRSPLLLDTSAVFAPPRTQSAYTSVDTPPLLSPLFDSDDDAYDTESSHRRDTLTFSGSSTPFSVISDFADDEGITGTGGGKLDAAPFIVTPEPYVPPTVCPVQEPNPRRLFRVLPPAAACNAPCTSGTGASSATCDRCHECLKTSPVIDDYSYLATECILCTRADFELESDSESEDSSNGSGGSSEDEDERYFPEIIIDTAACGRPSDSARVDADFLSLDVRTPVSVLQSALAQAQLPSSSSQKKSKLARKCVHRTSKSAFRPQFTVSELETKQNMDLGHVYSQENEFLEEEVPTDTPQNADKHFPREVIDEFQGIFEPKGMITWTKYTSELHQDMKLHAKKALLDYMKRDFTAAQLSARNCHCANCHDNILATRSHGAFARYPDHREVVHQNQNQRTNRTQLSSPGATSKAPSNCATWSTDKASAYAQPCGGGRVHNETSATSATSGGRGLQSGVGGRRSSAVCEMPLPLAANGSGATYAYGAKRSKFYDGPGAENVV